MEQRAIQATDRVRELQNKMEENEVSARRRVASARAESGQQAAAEISGLRRRIQMLERRQLRQRQGHQQNMNHEHGYHQQRTVTQRPSEAHQQQATLTMTSPLKAPSESEEVKYHHQGHKRWDSQLINTIGDHKVLETPASTPVRSLNKSARHTYAGTMLGSSNSSNKALSLKPTRITAPRSHPRRAPPPAPYV